MKKLEPYWFSEGLLDSEYKRYILLAYLQEVDHYYKHSKIFPVLQHLAHNIDCMQKFKIKCEDLEDRFPKEISNLDLARNRINYSTHLEDQSLLETIYEIIDYALPKVELKVLEGKEIFSSVERMIQIEPIGVTPLYNEEGYFLLYADGQKNTDIFKYKMYYLEKGMENRVLETTFLKKVKKTLSNTFYSIKNSLIKEFNHLPNPATYLIRSTLEIPKEETLLPVAKRLFLKNLAS